MNDIARPDIKPAFSVRNIPVVFSTDANYLPYVQVAVNSIAATIGDQNLDILILQDGIARQDQEGFLVDFRLRKGISIRFIDCSGIAASTALSMFEQKRRLSAATCYRLFLPDLLPAYDKIIYLDVDTTVCHDLGELYAIDLGDCLFGAAIDVVNSSGTREYSEWAHGYGFVEWDGFVNTGVMVMNLAAFRRASLLEELLHISVDASRWFCDQDALNFVCKGRIAHLDPRWNVQVGDYCVERQLEITKGEAFIYHFTGSKKPWSHPMHRYASQWWLNVRNDGATLWRKSIGLSKSVGVRKKVRVTVIVPVYNAEPYLWECLMSVLSQTEQSGMEVICVDDGSTDKSLEMLQALQRLDARVKLIRQSNQGPGAARNAGLKSARGNYIVFMDADDRFSSGVRLGESLEKAIEDDLDMLVCGANQMAADGTVLRKAYLNEALLPEERVFSPETLGRDLYQLTPQSPWGKLYRRKFLVENKMSFPALRRAEDFAFVQLSYTLAKKVGVMASPLVDHRIGVDTSCETTKDETPLLFLDGEKIFRDSMKRRGLFDKFREAADISLIRRLAYNLGAVRQFKSFVSIAEAAKDIYKSLRISLGDVMPRYIASAVEMLDEIVGNWNNVGQLAEIFVSIQRRGTISKLEYESEVTHAKERYETLANTLEKVRKIRDGALRERDSLKATLSEVRKVRDAALKDRDTLRKSLDATRTVRDAALKDRDTLRKTLDATRTVRDAALKERDALRKTLDATRTVRDAAQKERDTLRKTLDATRTVRDAALKERNSLRSTLDAVRAVRDSALKERNAARKELAALQAVHEKVVEICEME